MPTLFFIGNLFQNSAHGINSGISLVEKKYSIEHIETKAYAGYKSKIQDLTEKNPGIFLGHASPHDFGGRSPKAFVDLLIERGLNKKTLKPIHLYFLGCQFSVGNAGKYGEEVMQILKDRGYNNILIHVFDPGLFEYKNNENLMSSDWYGTWLGEIDGQWRYYGFSNKEAKSDFHQHTTKEDMQKNDKYMLAASNDPIQLVTDFGKTIRVAPPSPGHSFSSLLFKAKEEKLFSEEVFEGVVVTYKRK